MEREKIIEGNKLIALYMGASIGHSSTDGLGNFTIHSLQVNGKSVSYFESELRYHDTWNDIMPVWLKIMKWGKEEFGNYWEQNITEGIVCINTTRSHVKFATASLVATSPTPTIEQVYISVIDFIKWYNKNN